jgi:hypothetical protein
MIEQASLVLGNGNWAVKSDSLLGYKTIDGEYYPREMSVVRATSATRVNSEGLIEVVSLLGNELVTNGDFATDTNWSKSANTTISGGQAIFTANGANQSLIQANAWVADSLSGKKVQLTYTIISNSLNAGDFRIGGITGASAFNLTGLTASVGTYTVILDVRTSAGTDNAIDFYITSGATSGTLVIDNVSIKEVITNNIPRIDYSTGSSALLLEPQRTNLILYSQDISNAAWTKSSGGTGSTPVVTANYTASPLEGEMADRVIFNLNGGTASADLSTLQSSPFNLTLGNNVTYYMAVKTNDGSTVNMTLNNNLGLSEVKSITPEWTIIKTSTTATSTSSGVLRLRLRGTEAVSDYADISVAYAQLEVGSYATSYIPTTSASVTRNDDVCDKTSATALIGQTEGTVLIDIDLKLNNRFQTLWSLSDGISTSDFILVYHTDVNTLSARMRTVGVDQINISTATLPQGRYKLAMAYKENDVAFYVNGSLVGTDNSCAVPSPLNKISLTQIGTIINVREGFTKGFALWKTRLTNAELATLTTI